MAYTEYSVDDEIAEFFAKTSATRAACDARAEELVGGEAKPVTIQGNCSYTVYAGPSLEYIVQFRLKSLRLDMEVASLASQVYGSLAPTVSFDGQIGEESGDKEPLHAYVMSRMKGQTLLDFILSHDTADNSLDNFAYRRRLMAGVARFFALAWKSPQSIDDARRAKIRITLERELGMLLDALPSRLHGTVQKCIDSMDLIMSLPMVFLHKDFGECNIMVDEETCELVGVIDWAESTICPFGLNLHSLEALTGTLHLRNGWTRYEDYRALHSAFWETFKNEVGGLNNIVGEAISMARATGLLLSSGYTSRLKPDFAPIGNDERGRYNMMSLDGFLINPATKFEGIQ